MAGGKYGSTWKHGFSLVDELYTTTFSNNEKEDRYDFSPSDEFGSGLIGSITLKVAPSGSFGIENMIYSIR